jgi:hypothetical protein
MVAMTLLRTPSGSLLEIVLDKTKELLRVHPSSNVVLFIGLCGLFAWLISHQYFSLRTNQPPATSQFSQNKPAISHQPNEQAAALLVQSSPFQRSKMMSILSRRPCR